MNTCKIQIASATVICLLVLSGCATRSDIDVIRSQIESLQRSTDESLKVSQEAREIALNNSDDLASVRRTAEAAQRLALQAKENIDRAFEKSMHK
jgi:outer membrane murein-binding lipoprotein Lpp